MKKNCFALLTKTGHFIILNITFCGGGGIGRHASLRCLWRKSWPFKSAPPHKKTFAIGECLLFFNPILPADEPDCSNKQALQAGIPTPRLQNKI